LPRYYALIALTAALILGLLLCSMIALPFLSPIVWSITLAVLFYPLERRMVRLVKLRGLATGLTVTIAAVIVVVPIVLVSGTLINEVVESGNLLRSAMTPATWTWLAHQHPAFTSIIHWLTTQFDLNQLIQAITAPLGQWSAGIVQGSISSVVSLLVTFYFLFYILRDHDRALVAIERISTLAPGEFRLLIDRINNTVLASVYGTIVVASLQGLLGGLMFWWLDLPSPLFWGVVMGLLAIIPFLGAFVVWAPAAFVLAIQGHFLSATMLTLWGMIVVGLVDNVLYPVLVGRQLALHSMPAFIAIIGGLLLFGPYGIVLGPVIVAGTQTLLEIWRDRIDMQNNHGHPARSTPPPA
jgi:predicted PurR-regulated permease PerM